MSKEATKLDALKALGSGGMARQFGAGDDPAARRKAAKTLLGAVKPVLTNEGIRRHFTEPSPSLIGLGQEVAELKMRLIRVEASVTELGLRLSDLATTHLDPTGRVATTGPTALHSTDPTATTDVERRRALKAEQMRRYRQRKKAGETT
jgi:hypothetical protein